MTINCVQTALDVLESIHCKFPKWKSSLLQDLKMKLRLLSTFYMCGRKWGNGGHCESMLLSIDDIVHKHAQEIQSICLCLREDDDRVTYHTKWCHLYKGVSKFLVCIQQSFLQEIEELYSIFSDGSLQTSTSSQEVELVGIMDSLLQNLRDLLSYRTYSGASTCEIRQLEENVRFLKNFILFATFRGLEIRLMEDLLTHVEGLVVNAARLTFMCWYHNHPMMCFKFYELIKRIHPVESHVDGIYVEVLQALSQSSLHTTPGSYGHVLVDFVDSLLVLLWELLFFSTSYMEIFKHQMQKLYEELVFLRTILREHQDKFDELYKQMHDLIGVVIGKAGTIICLLFKGNEEGLVEKLEPLFSDLERECLFIMAEEAQKSPRMSASYFPETSMLVGFIDSVLEKMKSVSSYVADSVVLEKDKFQTVHEDLAFIISFLVDVMVPCDQNGKLQAIRSRVAVVTYETEFVLYSLMVGYSLQSMRLNSIAQEIKLIKTELLETYSEIPSAGEIPVLDEHVVGLGDKAREIIAVLTRGTKLLDIVSIVGMPGLGKTTLAKKVYSDPSITSHFFVQTWCCVSQVYSKRSLLLEILSGLVHNFDDKHLEKDEDDLSLELYQQLKGKKYLIILDDVWDIAAWNTLRFSFPTDANKSRILLTSRLHNVASQIKPGTEPHNLRFLTDDESWELLQKKICYEEGCPQALVAVGKAIAQHCKGLPLMILILAGLLSNKEQDTWESVAKSLREGTLSIAEHCKKILDLSYHHLPDYLKQCFLYFGAFQEDRQIPVRKMLWLWIGEGFVEKTEAECLEHVAEGYMMELIQKSLVMVAKKASTGRVKSCVLHDLLLDFCKSKGKEEHFLHCLQKYEFGTSIEPNKLYRLRVYLKRLEDFAESRVLCPHLHTLFFVADYEERYAEHWYNILNNFFQFKLLRVLELRRIDVGPFFPRLIEFLVHLRYLALAIAIEGTKLTIPSSIDQLSNLEIFLVEGLVLHVLLPDTLWNMKTLRHLSITGEASYWELPKENPEYCLENLETLSTVLFSCGHTMKEVMRKFPNIRRLKCELVREGMCSACTGDCMILALDFMSQLESLAILSRYNLLDDLHFQFPRNLKKIVLSWLGLQWSKIAGIDELPNLEVLKLLNNAFTGKIWHLEEGKFPKLRFLKLADLDLVMWTDLNDNFCCLEKLVLERCPHLKEVPSCFAVIPTLQIIQVSYCELATSSIKEIEKARMNNIGREDLKILIDPPS